MSLQIRVLRLAMEDTAEYPVYNDHQVFLEQAALLIHFQL